MNKKLLTVAVGAALAAAPLFAANAAPTVYGKFNVGVAMIDNGNDKVGDQDSSTIAVTDDASRLGVKGEEDLGGGLKALYQFEITADVDDGGFGSARDVYAGLGGGWGSVRLGQYNTAYKTTSTGIEIFGDTIADFTANGMSGETRQANNIGYTSPKFGGITIQAEYATATENGNDQTERNPFNAAVKWSAGPLYLGVAMYDFDLPSGSTGLDSSVKVAGQWKSGPLRVVAMHEAQSGEGTTLVRDTTNVAGSFSVGKNEFALSYTLSAAKGEGGAADTDRDCTMIGLGYFYNASKSTTLGVIYNTIDNDNLATCSGRMISSASVSGLPNPGAGKDPSGLQVQISTSF